MADVFTLPTKRVGSFSQLETECAALKIIGVDPVATVYAARALNYEPLLLRCFPAMPQHVRLSLLDGASQLILDQYGTWQIIKVDE